MSYNITRENESSDSEEELEILEENILNMKNIGGRKVKNETEDNEEVENDSQHECPSKRRRIEEVDLTSTSRSNEPATFDSSSSPSEQSNSAEPDVVIISDSEDEAEIVSVEPARPPPFIPVTDIRVPLHHPAFNELPPHMHEWEATVDRSTAPRHFQIWLRQQRELENRRRFATVSSARNANTRLAHTVFRLIITSSHSRIPQFQPFRDMLMINHFTIQFEFNGPNTSNNQSSCVVCLNNFEMRQIMRRLPCLHVFHRTCIDPWLTVHWKCPICRYNLPETHIN